MGENAPSQASPLSVLRGRRRPPAHAPTKWWGLVFVPNVRTLGSAFLSSVSLCLQQVRSPG